MLLDPGASIVLVLLEGVLISFTLAPYRAGVTQIDARCLPRIVR